MDHIACRVESDVLYQSLIDSQRSPPEATIPDAIMAAVHEVTQTLDATAIICKTKSGSTALRAARERAAAPILAVTPNNNTTQHKTQIWGLHCLTAEDIS